MPEGICFFNIVSKFNYNVIDLVHIEIFNLTNIICLYNFTSKKLEINYIVVLITDTIDY
jgi:hypothetical protein